MVSGNVPAARPFSEAEIEQIETQHQDLVSGYWKSKP
jgi:hypothetical protein